METWFFCIITLCLSILIKLTFDLLFKSPSVPSTNLPPGPPPMSVVDRLRFIGRGTELENMLKPLRNKFGPIVTLHLGRRRKAIFIFDRQLAHQALVTNGAVFADRPQPTVTAKITTCDQHNINSAGYGTTWRLLRRNLTAEIMHPARVRAFGHARRWVLDILIGRLGSDASSGNGEVKVIDHFHYAMFSLLTLMCFGDKLEEKQINQIETVHRQLLISIRRFEILNFMPKLTKILLYRRWAEFYSMRKQQADVVIPLINARKNHAKIGQTEAGSINEADPHVTAYADTLLALELQEGGTKRRLTEEECMALCSEFINAGTDTTSTALQWIMANVVKYPEIQAKLIEELKSFIDPSADEVKEEELSKLHYVKAVVLEGLRRHPPGPFVLPHAVTEETELGGYRIPKDAIINFMVAEIGRDPEAWEDPLEFSPERFLEGEAGKAVEVDITGTREIKMMPFGVGRRICPGLGLATLHLEYFVANLVWKFEWKAVDEINMEEKSEFTTMMKHPLRARISERVNKS
ncbi:Cytochrome P450 89A2-like protein [Drosera capensis]